MNNKQTAVEWLVNQLDSNFILEQILNNDYTVDTLIGQAKEMEKEQMLDLIRFLRTQDKMGKSINDLYEQYVNER